MNKIFVYKSITEYVQNYISEKLSVKWNFIDETLHM